jgi:REP element-mobilizing transposase RayT
LTSKTRERDKAHERSSHDGRVSHTKWDCKYQVVFFPKGRKKALFGSNNLNGGRKPFAPTAEERSDVRALASCGTPQDVIARYIHISLPEAEPEQCSDR